MPSPKNFVNLTTPVIDAAWLNQVDALVATQSGPPTSGTYNAGDFKKNENFALFGQVGAQYLISGWYCVLGGTPGTWMAVQLPVGPVSGAATPAPPAPAPSAPYSYRFQGENMTGATLNSSIPGYDGTGFADWATTSGVTLTASFPNVPVGTYTLNIRYYVYNTQNNNVRINGVMVTPEPAYTVQTPTAWATVTLTNIAITSSGTQTVDLISDWGFTYYDYVELVQQAAPAPAPTNPAGPYASGLPAAGPDTTTVPGTTDPSGDTTINGLITTAGAGGTVTIPGGKIYTINAPIVPLNNQTIKAAAGTAVILKAANGYTGLMVNLSGLTNVTIQNITFDGNYTNRLSQEGLQTASCVQISGGSGHSIHNNAFNNCPSYAIWSYNANSLSIRLNTGTENYQALRLDGNNLATTGIVEGNSFINTTLYKSYQGMDILNTKSLSIKSNTVNGFGLTNPTSHGFQGTWGNGIYLLSANDSYLIENNSCNNNYWSSCVCGQGSTNGTVQYNYFDRGNFSQGVQAFWYEQTGADVITVTRNIMNGGASIGDTGGDHCTFTFNQVTVDTAGTGLDVNQNCNVLTCTDNTFTGRGTAPDKGSFLWNKSTVAANVHMQRNTFTNFNNAVYINNTGGTGTVYNLIITGNTFVNDAHTVVVPAGITIDPSCNIQTTSGVGGPFYPFGSRLDGAYPHGITVTGQTNAAMDQVVKNAFANWKNNRLVAVANYTPTTGIFAGTTLTGLYADRFSTATQTVSEGMGYGMLIAVLMAGYEPNAKAYFDGMFRLARAFPAYGDYLPTGTLAGPNIQNYLMDWKVDISTLSSLGGGSNASDGDMDMALALFMAHRQWGSAASTTATQINYLQEGLNVVAALKAVNFASNGVMYVGGQYDLSRTSDAMPFLFHVYKTATTDTFWDNANTNSYTLINTVINANAATTHMPPDWIWHPLSANPVPSPGNKIEGPNEGNYAANALRDPLRWGQSYLFFGDTTWKGLANALLAWFETQPPTSGNPAQTSWAYTLAGNPLSTPNYFDPAMNSGLMIGAMCGGNAGDQAYLNACWTDHAANLATSYYNCELQLLALLIASGNWWKPF